MSKLVFEFVVVFVIPFTFMILAAIWSLIKNTTVEFWQEVPKICGKALAGICAIGLAYYGAEAINPNLGLVAGTAAVGGLGLYIFKR